MGTLHVLPQRGPTCAVVLGRCDLPQMLKIIEGAQHALLAAGRTNCATVAYALASVLARCAGRTDPVGFVHLVRSLALEMIANKGVRR